MDRKERLGYGLSLAWVAALIAVSCGPTQQRADTDGPAHEATGQHGAPVALPATVSFNQHVRPILSDQCFACHGPDTDNQESEFRLDSEQASRMNLAPEGEPPRYGVVPGKPEESEILARILHPDPSQRMPPPSAKKQAVTPHEAAILRQWILDGAAYEPHWAFVPPVRPDVPAESAIDQLIAEALVGSGMPVHPEADAAVLLRRLHLTLTGLTPQPQVVEAYLQDPDPARYEKMVDLLIETPAFAERLAVDWMDAARYADSYGYQVDRGRQVWPWRDWVLDAFQANMPYDQFIVEQLAGDLIPNPTQASRIATAFNRLHMQKVEGGSVPEEFRVEYVADRTQTAATVFMGLTMECARCHDHKFDPITQSDYFQTFALFNSIDESGLYAFFTQAVPSPTIPVLKEAEEKALASKQEAVSVALAAVADREKEARQAFAAWRSRWDQTITVGDPVASFAFDEAEGSALENQVKDQPGGRLDAKYTKRVPGIRGQAVQVDGDSAVMLGRNGPFERHLPFSVSLWLNLPTTYERAFAFGRTRAAADAASRGYELLIDQGRLNVALVHFAPGNEIRIRSRLPVPLQSWQQIAVTYDGSAKADGLRLYLNGEALETEVLKDHLTKEIYFAKPGKDGKNNKRNPELHLGARMRDTGLAGASFDELRIFATALSALQVRALHTDTAQPKNDEEVFAYYLNRHATDYLAAQKTLAVRRQACNEYRNSRFHMMVMQELPEPRPTYVLKRGLYSAPDKTRQVAPGPPAWLLPFTEEFPRDRLGFAQWLIHPQNPLTARVTVNRYWQLAFGRGLVATPNDFGSQGAFPSHPKLLDYLARTFIDSGWDVRALFKTMMMSQAFRRDSTATPKQLELDPHNTLLARGPARPMTAEMLRDTVLQAAELLSPVIGGGSVNPYTPHNATYRRSLYTQWMRNNPSPEMLIFGAPRRQVCTVQREETLTPLQPLVLMNSPQFVEAARVLATRSLQQQAPEAQTAARIFFRLASRPPRPEEARVLAQLLSEQRSYFKAHPEVAKKLSTTGNIPLDETLIAAHSHAEIAAWTMLASTVANLDAFYMVR